MTKPASTEWSSMHLFIARADDADALALFASDVMASYPVHANDWFFIRYPEGGVHIRLRIGPRASAIYPDVRARMAERCRVLANASEPSDWVRRFGQPDPTGRMWEPGETVDIPYQPETDRYGGSKALKINERLFRISTAIVVKSLVATRDRGDLRAQIASDLMMTAVAVIARQIDPASFFTTYARQWRAMWPHTPNVSVQSADTAGNLRSHFDRRVEALQNRAPGTDLASVWGAELRAAHDQFAALHEKGQLVSPVTGGMTRTLSDRDDAIQSMMASQIHMLNNRLGLWPDSEIVMSEQLVHRLRHDGA